MRSPWFPGVNAKPSVSSPSTLRGYIPAEWKAAGTPDKVAKFMRDRWLLSWPNKGYGNWGVGNYCPAGSYEELYRQIGRLKVENDFLAKGLNRLK